MLPVANVTKRHTAKYSWLGNALFFGQTPLVWINSRVSLVKTLRIVWALMAIMLAQKVANAQFTYTNNGDNTITVTGFTGSGGDVTIPDRIEGFPVTTIGSEAFSGSSVTRINIPATVIDIGDQAFFFCENLTTVYFQGDAPNLGSSVFGALTFGFPPGWTYPNCYYLPETTGWASNFGGCPTFMWVPPYICTVNNGTITISGYTGNGSSLVIPNTIGDLPVVAIGDSVFVGSSLTSITIPNSVVSIGYSVFADCTALKSVFCAGNAPTTTTPPSFDETEFQYDDGAIVYYLPGTTGWSPVFGDGPTAYGGGSQGGAQTKLWLPAIQVANSGFQTETNQFGFNINWANGQTVVVEGCTDMNNPVWCPLATNTLTSGLSYFSDAQWTNYPARYYRLRSP
jgi:hypothetical protein